MLYEFIFMCGIGLRESSESNLTTAYGEFNNKYWFCLFYFSLLREWLQLLNWKQTYSSEKKNFTIALGI